MDPRLCELCREIDLYTLGVPLGGGINKCAKIHRTRAQLSDDCPLCCLFLNPSGRPESPEAPRQQVKSVNIEVDRLLDDPTDVPVRFRYILSSALQSVKSTIGVAGYYPPISRIRAGVRDDRFDFDVPWPLDVFVGQDSPEEAKRYVGGRVVPAADSDASLEQVSGWLKECLAKHSRCQMGISGRMFGDDPTIQLLPNRVVHVGGGGLADQPRLLLTKGMRSRYVALSYCWEHQESGHYPFRLERGNLAALQEQVPLAELPASIRDAIDFTQRLGIPYLWVDRLCIVQDDKDDWADHADRMCDIYEGASLTIAALAAETRDEGLYLPRPLRSSVRVKFTTRHGEVGPVHIASPFDPGPAAINEGSGGGSVREEELGMSRWSTRGWVMQERLMSRRIVYFGRTQIFWECQEMTRKQDGIQDDVGIGGKLGLYEELRFEPLRIRLHTILPWVIPTPEPVFWRKTVRDYTNRNLTYGTDKGAAIAGVAGAVKLRLDMPNYAHGIFLERVDQMLLWYGKLDLTSPQTPRAPSWSWMAHDGRIHMLKPGLARSWLRQFGECAFLDRKTAQSLGAVLKPPPTEDFDPVALRISGARIAPMKWHAEVPARAQLVEKWLHDAFLAYDYTFVSRSAPRMALPKLISKAKYDGSGWSTVTMGATDQICGIIKLDPSSSHGPPESNISCLIVAEETVSGSWWRRGQGADRKTAYHLLALQQVLPSPPGAKLPTYQRVGVAQTVWAGSLGFPVHNEATLGDILIV
ncbi:hypothetical protein OQA88_2421 [Cercophora sp. LCS_1]